MKTVTVWCKILVNLISFFAGLSCIACEIHWGAETNGYRGGVLVFDHDSSLVRIYAEQPDWEVRPPFDFHTYTNSPEKVKEKVKSEYFRKSLNPPYRVMVTTNWSPGPMKICDSKGQELPALNPEAMNPAFFPEMPHWDFRVAHARPWGTGIYPCDVPLFGIDASKKQDVVAGISLGDYFRIKEPGEYQFTVWPVIYKQSKTNKDIYLRIDLPPVTIPIKWTGNAQK